MLVVVCAWCERFLGVKETAGPAAISHGMCRACLARHQWDEPPTLVFGREHAHLLPVFQEILKGTPEIRVVIDRRRAAQAAGLQEVAEPGLERRRASGASLH